MHIWTLFALAACFTFASCLSIDEAKVTLESSPPEMTEHQNKETNEKPKHTRRTARSNYRGYHHSRVDNNNYLPPQNRHDDSKAILDAVNRLSDQLGFNSNSRNDNQNDIQGMFDYLSNQISILNDKVQSIQNSCARPQTTQAFPAYMPFPVYYPFPQCSSAQSGANAMPTLGNRFPEINQIWSTTVYSDEDEGEPDDINRPVNFQPVPAIVAHRPKTTTKSPPTNNRDIQVPGLCDVASLSCCRRFFSDEQKRSCFAQVNCPNVDVTRNCSANTITNILEAFDVLYGNGRQGT